MNSLGSIPWHWGLTVLAGIAIVVGVGVGLWQSNSIKLDRAIRLESRGMRLLFAGYPHRAEAMLLRSWRLAEAADGPEGGDVGPIVANLAQIYEFQEKFDEAERLYRRAIEIRENALGRTDPFLALALGNLAQMLHSRGREEEAAELEARAQAITEANPDDTTLQLQYRGTFTSAGLVPEPSGWRECMEAAVAAEDAGQIQEHLMAALALTERQGPAGPHLGETLHALGTLHYQRGSFEAAEAHLRRAVSVREVAFGPENASVATSLNNLAAVYRAQNRNAEALPLLERALAIDEAGVNPNESELVTSPKISVRMGISDILRLFVSGHGIPLRVSQRKLLDFDDDARDQYAHGFTYGPGLRLPQDLAEAAKWDRVSVEQGNADAQYVLGYMYEKGSGVPQSHPEAVKWYRLAARQGQALAQAALGSMYSLGRGVPLDYIEAYILLSRAISRLPSGEKRDLAVSNRVVLAELMAPEQIAEAESIVRDSR